MTGAWQYKRGLKRLGRPVRGALRYFGWELSRTTEARVRFESFESLCRAYELRLAETGEPVPVRDSRVKLMARLIGTPPGEAYAIVRALADTAAIPGDVCEFGVAQGETSALIAAEILDGERRLHLFDSFQGLPRPTAQDELKDDIFGLGSMSAYMGTMSCPADLVRARLAAVGFPTSRCVIHEGFVESILQTDRTLPKSVSFAYLDFDFYEPTRLTLEFLSGVTHAGAIIVVDDYDFFSTGAKTAVDEFVEAKRGTADEFLCNVPDARYGHFATLRRSSG